MTEHRLARRSKVAGALLAAVVLGFIGQGIVTTPASGGPHPRIILMQNGPYSFESGFAFPSQTGDSGGVTFTLAAPGLAFGHMPIETPQRVGTTNYRLTNVHVCARTSSGDSIGETRLFKSFPGSGEITTAQTGAQTGVADFCYDRTPTAPVAPAGAEINLEFSFTGNAANDFVHFDSITTTWKQ